MICPLETDNQQRQKQKRQILSIVPDGHSIRLRPLSSAPILRGICGGTAGKVSVMQQSGCRSIETASTLTFANVRREDVLSEMWTAKS